MARAARRAVVAASLALLRIWRTQVDRDRLDEYERFAAERSLPTFREQDGFLGVFFARRGAECLVVTLWRDEDAVTRLARSSTYAETVDAITAAGFLVGEASVEVFELQGASLATAAAELVAGGSGA